MKKVFLFAFAVALTLSSCVNKSQGGETAADSTETATDTAAVANTLETVEEGALSAETKSQIGDIENIVNTAISSQDKTAAVNAITKAQEVYKQLVEAGKLDEAKAFAASIKNSLSQKAEDIKALANGNTTILQLVEGVKNIPTDAQISAEQTKAAAQAAAKVIENAPEAAKKAAEAKANQVVDDAKATATKKLNEAAEKQKQETAKKVNDARQKANDAVNKAANKTLKDLGL